MKSLIVLAAALSAFVAVAAAPLSDLAPEARKQLMLEKTGGLIDIPAKGKIIVVNAQKRIPAEAVVAQVESLKTALRVNVEYVEGELELYKVPEGATCAICIGDCEKLPPSLVAAENSWGLLNVAPLFSAPDKAERRFKRMFARVAAFTLGQSQSQFKGSPLQTVRSMEDLDRIVIDSLTYDSVSMMLKTLSSLGVTQTRRTSYRKACMDGWAPAPTNDYQKVIWEEVHAKPTKPMKIEFDPAKGE